MLVSQYFVFFIFFSFLGWVWETIYCSSTEKHFSNRGFLFGPICPIYGASIVAGIILFTQIHIFNPEDMALWQIFLICAIGSAIAEFGTSYYLEKRFHARWWDYSNVPFNLQGRICLPCSIAFGLAGVVLVHWMLTELNHIEMVVSPFIFEILALILMGIFGADLALTEASLSTLLQKIEATDKEFTERAEAAYQAISNSPQRFEKRVNAYEEELRDRTKLIADGMTWNQRNKFGSMRSFRSSRHGHHEFRVGEHIREALRESRVRR